MIAPSTILILDTETDGTEEGSACIEVACILYSVTHAAPIRSFASLIHADTNAAEDVNHIPAALLSSLEVAAPVWATVRRFAAAAGAIVAHNADFDRRFVPEVAIDNFVPWICSMDDLTWPKSDGGRSLISIALAHGLGVATAHRALADCDMIARLLTRIAEMGVNLPAFLERGLRPKARYQALVPFERNHEAKEAGFRWDGDARMWARKMAIEDAAALPFKVREVPT